MKFLKKSLCAAFSLVFLLGSAGCGDEGSYEQPKEYFELSAFTDNSDSGAFDSKYFYRNDFTLASADVFAMYVPEGRHEDENGEDNYGGYYYLYGTPADINGQGMYVERWGEDTDASKKRVTNPVLRSKDLVDWELCGVYNGHSTMYDFANTWVNSGVAAPEVVYDENTGKYFLYAQAHSHRNDGSRPGAEYPDSADGHDRFFISIFISDYPTGPFEIATSENYYGDKDQPNLNGKVITKENPPINFRHDLGLEEYFGVIDAHPFIDADGQMYMYFCRHIGTNYNSVNIWGMKMKDMLTPDYDSMTMLIRGGYTSVTKNENWENAPWLDSSYDMGEEYVLEEGEHGDGNEGPFMVAKNYTDEKTGETVRRYFLHYTGGGYNNKYYDFSQTICDGDPLGTFVKPKQYASSIVGTSKHNDWNNSSGHGCIVYSPDGEEMFYLGGAQGNSSIHNAWKYGRWLTVDKVHFVETEEYGLMLYGNGPTKSVQPKMYSQIGVKNIAPEATVTVSSSGSNSGVKYLNDELFVSTEYYKDWEFETEGDTKITLTFAEPRTVSSVLVYNSYSYDYAFSKVDMIEFKLAEKPSWFTAGQYVSVARISGIEFNKEFISSSYEAVRSGTACVASFNEIKVNSVTIGISKKIKTENKKIRVSDIVILGN
ncbi:MAG: hypothetical protein IJY62_00825 [Clostridia bacterium]|nr:hypothetical protein [Clostridia bacterium]